MKNSARGDSSTGSELKAVEEACREASRTVEPCELCASAVKDFRHLTAEALRAQSKEFLIKKYSDLCELCTTMVESLRSLRKFCGDSKLLINK